MTPTDQGDKVYVVVAREKSEAERILKMLDGIAVSCRNCHVVVPKSIEAEISAIRAALASPSGEVWEGWTLRDTPNAGNPMHPRVVHEHPPTGPLVPYTHGGSGPKDMPLECRCLVISLPEVE